MVKKGQLLLVIDEEPYQVALDSARAKQAEAEAALSKAEESKGREVAAAQLELDQAQLVLAQIQERRNRALLARNAGSAEDLDKAEADRKRWEAQVEADRANLDQAKADYAVGIAVGQGPGRGRQGRRPRRRAEPGLLPDVRPDRRPDRRGPGQGRQPRRARPGRRRRLHRPGHDPAARPDRRRHPAQLARPRPDHAALIERGAGRPAHPPGPVGRRRSIPTRGECYFIDNRSTRRPRPSWPRPGSPTPAASSCPASTSRSGWSSTGSRTPSSSPPRRSMETEAGPVVHVVDEDGKVADPAGRRGPDPRGPAGDHQGARRRRAR